MKNNVLKSHNYCTGCGVCSINCPLDIITIELNEDGFYSPRIEEDKCIECGKCQDVCIKFKNEENNLNIGEFYSARSKNKEIIKNCTSGGIAYEISKFLLSKNYIVVGTKYNYEKDIAETILVDNFEDLKELRGSKYIQSYTEKALKEIKNIIKDNPKQKFLFIGTPCQIYGFEKFLLKNKLRENFILVDLFCHGVPSYLIWNNYIKEIRAKIKNITEIKFRDKEFGWHNYLFKVKGETEFKELSEKNTFYQYFFDNILLNKACFKCEVRKAYSSADIRLGDFWGKRYIKNREGISLVLVLTEKGKKLLKEINSIEILEKVSSLEGMEKQATEDYQNEKLYDEAIKNLKLHNDINRTLEYYRKNFSYKRKLKLYLKRISIYLPENIKIILKKFFQ